MPKPKNQLYLNRYMRLLQSPITHCGYLEKHHICPRSLGGSDAEENLINLPSRLHFIAHWMLWKAYDTDELAYAFWAMCHQKNAVQKNRYTKINSKTYAMLKERRSLLIKNSNSNRWKDKEWATKMKEKLSKAAQTPQEKQRRSQLRKTLNDQTYNNSVARMKKLWSDPEWSAYAKQRMREANLHRKKIIVVDDIEYGSVNDVAIKFNISIATVRQRIKSKSAQFKNWSYSPAL